MLVKHDTAGSSINIVDNVGCAVLWVWPLCIITLMHTETAYMPCSCVNIQWLHSLIFHAPRQYKPYAPYVLLIVYISSSIPCIVCIPYIDYIRYNS